MNMDGILKDLYFGESKEKNSQTRKIGGGVKIFTK